MRFPRCDMHIHTAYLGCANETMAIDAIIRACGEVGNEWIGITDHLNTAEQLPLHRKILDDIRALDTGPPVHFGVELNFTGCDGDFVFSRQIKADYGFQFAIGGIHSTYLDAYDLDEVIRIQHRHHLRVCEDGLVDVLVHPYWFNRNELQAKGFPEFESVACVPRALARQLGQAARDTGTAIEINASAILYGRSDDYLKAYFDYLAILADEGVTFAAGSDAHDITELKRVRLAWEMFDRLGLDGDRLWRPPGEPIMRG